MTKPSSVGNDLPRNVTGIRLAITQANGIKHEQVVRFTVGDEHQLREQGSDLVCH